MRDDLFTKTFPLKPLTDLIRVYYDGTELGGITPARYYKGLKTIRSWLDRAVADAEKVYTPEALR